MDKEWDKYRVAFVIQGKPHYVEEDERTVNTKVVDIEIQLTEPVPWFYQDLFQEFRGISLHGQPQQSGRPWIGLEHTNKVPFWLNMTCLYFLCILGQQEVKI